MQDIYENENFKVVIVIDKVFTMDYRELQQIDFKQNKMTYWSFSR